MKVWIGKYPTSVSCYWLVQKILFWKSKDDELVLKISEMLTYGSLQDFKQEPGENALAYLERLSEHKRTPLARGLEYFNKFLDKQPSYIKIDDYDLWNADYTLAQIILPLLKKFREEDYRSIKVDYEDVPEYLRPSEEELKSLKASEVDSKYWRRTDYILDEMIYAFDTILNTDNYSKEYDSERVQRGTTFFGKYFRGLWL